jgi:hypothetical protein
VLISIPGNHDLARPDSKLATVRLLTKWNQNPEIHQELWNENESEYRNIITNAFSNYVTWVNECPFTTKVKLQAGILPGDFSLSVDVNGFRIGVVGLNTAFLQLTSGNYENRLAWDSRQLEAVCSGNAARWAESHHFCFLMTHHPTNWLDKESLEKQLAEIAPAGRFLLHFYGHMHELRQLKLAVDAGPVVRLEQGKALFGLREFGEEKKGERLHGYSIGTIYEEQTGSEKALLRHWPRTAQFHSVNGWKIIPDHTSSLENDEGTVAESVALRAIKNLDVVTPYILRGDRNTDPHSNKLLQAETKPIEWPRDDPGLRPYCDAIAAEHRHIRFVEIPQLQDISDVELDSLYITPMFSDSEINPDLPPRRWPPRFAAIKALEQHKHITLLGDPGSGKSTLVSCLSWQLCRPKPTKENEWVKTFGGCVPLTMILRELRLKSDITWESLLEAFLEHRIGKLLQNRVTIEALLRAGRGIILLDGIDEIANLTIRRKLRDAVQTGMATYPQSRWIFTSRIVGYDRVAFHIKTEKVSTSTKTDVEVVQHAGRIKRQRTVLAQVLYMAPFDDEQIRDFSLKWYTQHEKAKENIENTANNFVNAIRENEGTQHLARIAYLLTLMALIHHKNLKLPHGRTDLYQRIATAYLESIDLRRQLDQLPYSLAQKKLWLAEVGFRMQLRRQSPTASRNQSEILASKAEVELWLRNAMADSGARNSKMEAEDLLNYFARRSGLLLPRGEGKFAFMHLSLQEYFAACFLLPRLAQSRFATGKQKIRISDRQLRTWAKSEAWCETFVLLFELLAEKSVAETEGFLHYLFGGRLNSGFFPQGAPSIDLLAQLATDPFVLISAETRRKLRQQCWRWVLARFPEARIPSKAVQSLLRDSGGSLERAWKESSISRADLQRITKLSFNGCSSLSDLSALSDLKKLNTLDLSYCTGIRNIDSIASLGSLRYLILQGCSNLQSIEPLRNATGLRTLVLSQALDLAPLSKLPLLTDLHLHYVTSQIDLAPLVNHRHLRHVCLGPLRQPQDIKRILIKIPPEFDKNPDTIPSPGVKRIVFQSRREFSKP